MRFRDRRSGKVVVVAHCILNQNSRTPGLAHRPAIADAVVDVLFAHGVGFLQMPCPELTFSGADRSAKTGQDYDTPKYRKHCRQIASSTAGVIREFVDSSVEVVALRGIRNSPSCDIGELEGETGILVEELLASLKRNACHVATQAIDLSDMTPDVAWLEGLLGKS